MQENFSSRHELPGGGAEHTSRGRGHTGLLLLPFLLPGDREREDFHGLEKC